MCVYPQNADQRVKFPLTLLTWPSLHYQWFFGVRAVPHRAHRCFGANRPTTAVMMAGASPDSSSPLRNIYLLSASYMSERRNDTHWSTELYQTVQNVTARASLGIRVGFFSICAHSQADQDPAATGWQCAKDPEDLSVASLEVNDPLGLIGFGAHFAGGVVFYGLLQVASPRSTVSQVELTPAAWLALYLTFWRLPSWPLCLTGTRRRTKRRAPFG